MKKILLFLVFVMLAGSLAWAGGNTDDASTTGGPVVLDLMSREDPAAVGDFTQKLYYQYLMDEFNIDLRVNPIAGDAFKDRFQVVILSGDLPDFIAGVQSDFATINSLGQQGVLEEVGQYYGDMPNLMEFFANNLGEKEHLQDVNGDTYQFGSGQRDPSYSYSCVVRKDMLDSVGFDVNSVETFDDYLDMFRALKEANGGEPPLQNRKGLNKMLRFGMWSIGRDRRYVYYDQENDKWGYPYVGDDARYVVNWYATLFSEGIYHPDAITYSDEIWEPEMATGGVWHAVLSDSFGWAFTNEDKLQKAGKFPEMDFVPVPPPTYKGKLYQWPKEYLIFSTEMVVKPDLPEEKISKIVELVDWLYSKDGYYINGLGPKDETWFYHEGNAYSVFSGADGKPVYPAEAKPPGPLRSREEADAYRTQWSPLYKFGLLAPDRARLLGEDKYYDLYKPMYAAVYQGKPAPTVNFGEMEIDEVNTLRNVLHTATWEWVAKFLTGLEPMSKWDEFQDQLKVLGVERYEQLWNEAYAAMK